MAPAEATLTGIIEAMSNSVAGGQRVGLEQAMGEPQVGEFLRPTQMAAEQAKMQRIAPEEPA